MTHGVPFLYDLAWRLRPGVVMGLKVSPIALPQTVRLVAGQRRIHQRRLNTKKNNGTPTRKYQELTENQQKSQKTHGFSHENQQINHQKT